MNVVNEGKIRDKNLQLPGWEEIVILSEAKNLAVRDCHVRPILDGLAMTPVCHPERAYSAEVASATKAGSVAISLCHSDPARLGLLAPPWREHASTGLKQAGSVPAGTDSLSHGTFEKIPKLVLSVKSA